MFQYYTKVAIENYINNIDKYSLLWMTKIKLPVMNSLFTHEKIEKL